MQTFGQFKRERGVDTIEFINTGKRPFSDVKGDTVIVADGCDIKKPLFVVQVHKNKLGEPIERTYAICNSDNVKEVFAL